MKIVWRVVKWALFGIAGIFLFGVVVNLFDEELRPEAKPFLERGFKIAEGENGFFFLAGFSAPRDADPHAVGRKIIAYYEDTARKRRAERRYNDPPLGGPKLDFGEVGTRISVLCEWQKNPCLKRYAEQREAVADLAKRGATLLERYRKLASYPQYEDYVPASFDTPMPEYLPFTRATLLRNAQCAVLSEQGRGQECLDLLRQSVRYSRRMLEGSRTLIGKALAVATLHRDYRLLSEILNTRPALARTGSRAIGEMLAPLSAAEKDFSSMPFEVFPTLPFLLDDITTWRGVIFVSDDQRDEPVLIEWAANKLFLKRNATINFAYELHKFQMETLRLQPDKLVESRDDYSRKMVSMTSLDGLGLSLIYNPKGKILMAIAYPVYADYQLMAHDLDGFSRLVALQWQIAEKGVVPERVPEFLKRAGERYADPYTGRPMDWDAKSRTLSFRAHGTRYATGGRFAVKL